MSLMSPLNEMREQMNRIFHDMEALRFPMLEDYPIIQNAGKEWLPAVDIEEMDGNYHLKIEVPGIKPENLKVEVFEDQVIVRGENRKEEVIDKANIYRRECSYGNFYRRIPLPGSIKQDRATAELKHGVLNLTLPKTSEKKGTDVKIITR